MIQVEGLHKQFGELVAVDGVSFTAEADAGVCVLHTAHYRGGRP